MSVGVKFALKVLLPTLPTLVVLSTHAHVPGVLPAGLVSVTSARVWP